MKKNTAQLIILLILVVALAGVTVLHHSAEGPEAPTVSLPAATPTPIPVTTPEPVETPALEETPTPVETPAPTPTPEPGPSLPDIDITEWQYMLVNAQNNVGEYMPELTSLEGQQSFDSRAVDELQDFIDAARAEGLSVYLSSSYRSYSEQAYLFERKVNQYGGDTAVAATIVAPPGTSEHQTGLCADITDIYYASKDRSLENTALFKWMKAHCHEYGFILRYPDNKTDITGIMYEPWHFRYVGVEAATYIMENDLCLEEFHELYK